MVDWGECFFFLSFLLLLTEVICCDDDAAIEFDGDDGGAGDDWGGGMCRWARGLEVRMVVSAVDIIAGLSSGKRRR